uniref:hypothetical protein n=1 Tax=Azospirillum argentinense TaxID=2970906 RepID=UPI0010C0DA12|nr:hypothetical protein [Azospirillum argentinense]
MPKTEILYYPNMEPSKQKLRAYLLLFDRVLSIVPGDALSSISYETRRLMDDDNGSFVPLAPPPDVVAMDVGELRMFERAVEAYKLSRPARDQRRLKLVIGPSGEVRIPGYSLVLDQKFGMEIRRVLEDHGLIVRGGTQIAGGFGARGFEIVDEFAAMLIMARLADKLSDRNGLPTISDVPWAFSLNTAIGLGLDNRQIRRGYLANLILKMVIPSHLSELTDAEFERVRGEYKGVRVLFSRCVREWSFNYLEDPRDIKVFLDRARELSNDFSREVERLKSARNMNAIRRWLPLGLNCASVLVKHFVPGGAIIGDAMKLSVDAGKEVGFLGAPHEDKLAKMMAGMQREIEYSANFMRWIGD